MNRRASKIMVRLQPGSERATLAQPARMYRWATGVAIDFTFMDYDCQALYAAENRVEALSRYFSGMAIVISCFGRQHHRSASQRFFKVGAAFAGAGIPGILVGYYKNGCRILSIG